MKTSIKLFLLMYDITHDRTLQKVAKKLQQNGFERINYSVWIGWNDPLKPGILKTDLQKLMQNEKAAGSVLYSIPISSTVLGRIRNITGHKPRELEYWLGRKKILFFG